MKFLFLTINEGPWGGSEVLWCASANRALMDGNEVFISMYFCNSLPPQLQELKDKGAVFYYMRRFYPSIHIRLYKKILNFFLPVGKKKTYHDYIFRFSPDHVFFNLGQGGEIARDSSDLMILIRQMETSYSIFCHELWLKDKELDNKEYKSNLIECFSNAKRVFFTSKMIMENTKNKLKKSFSNFEILNHPLQNKTSDIIPYPEMNKVKFGMLGRLSMAVKGHDLVIKAFAGNCWKNRDWELNIYGSGPDELAISEMISSQGLVGRIHLHGFIGDLTEAWSVNHIFLLPSRSDSGPIILFETMLAGRAVIANRIGAMPEYIVNGHNGVISSDCSLESFLSSLEIAWNSRLKWRKWGENSRETMLEKYDFEADQTLLKKLEDYSWK